MMLPDIGGVDGCFCLLIVMPELNYSRVHVMARRSQKQVAAAELSP